MNGLPYQSALLFANLLENTRVHVAAAALAALAHCMQQCDAATAALLLSIVPRRLGAALRRPGLAAAAEDAMPGAAGCCVACLAAGMLTGSVATAEAMTRDLAPAAAATVEWVLGSRCEPQGCTEVEHHAGVAALLELVTTPVKPADISDEQLLGYSLALAWRLMHYPPLQQQRPEPPASDNAAEQLTDGTPADSASAEQNAASMRLGKLARGLTACLMASRRCRLRRLPGGNLSPVEAATILQLMFKMACLSGRQPLVALQLRQARDLLAAAVAAAPAADVRIFAANIALTCKQVNDMGAPAARDSFFLATAAFLINTSCSRSPLAARSVDARLVAPAWLLQCSIRTLGAHATGVKAAAGASPAEQKLEPRKGVACVAAGLSAELLARSVLQAIGSASAGRRPPASLQWLLSLAAMPLLSYLQLPLCDAYCGRMCHECRGDDSQPPAVVSGRQRLDTVDQACNALCALVSAAEADWAAGRLPESDANAEVVASAVCAILQHAKTQEAEDRGRAIRTALTACEMLRFLAEAAAELLRRHAASMHVTYTLLGTLAWVATPGCWKQPSTQELVAELCFLLAAAAATDANSRTLLAEPDKRCYTWAQASGALRELLGSRRAAPLRLVYAALYKGVHPAAAAAAAAAAADVAAEDAAAAAAAAAADAAAREAAMRSLLVRIRCLCRPDFQC